MSALLGRRGFLRAAAVAAASAVVPGRASGHHRPGHAGGPKPHTVSPAAVVAVAASAAALFPAGGHVVTMEL